ncbi:uncharacterized protein LOC114908581 [Monodon monoceros]|uniref:uncharacterized protein LOC114908581 n=1 Tax=Monodon monoceros TaxID=40151 RepID=UPI0010F544D7|nr:uncharacterized protein LOC114908581 [Monodon monoceros]
MTVFSGGKLICTGLFRKGTDCGGGEGPSTFLSRGNLERATRSHFLGPKASGSFSSSSHSAPPQTRGRRPARSSRGRESRPHPPSGPGLSPPSTRPGGHEDGGPGRPHVPRAGWKVEKGLGPKGGGVCSPGPGKSEQDGGLGSAVEQNASWS